MDLSIKSSIQKITIIGLFSAIISVFSVIMIPMPSGVPITLQTFIIALCGFTLGKKFGTISTLVYVMLGGIGLPIFAGFNSGIGALFGLTGGFIWGFILLSLCCGISMGINKKIISYMVIVLGLILCHTLGILQYSIITKTNLLNSALIMSIPYLLKDIISIAVARYCAIKIIVILKKSKVIIS